MYDRTRKFSIRGPFNFGPWPGWLHSSYHFVHSWSQWLVCKLFWSSSTSTDVWWPSHKPQGKKWEKWSVLWRTLGLLKRQFTCRLRETMLLRRVWILGAENPADNPRKRSYVRQESIKNLGSGSSTSKRSENSTCEKRAVCFSWSCPLAFYRTNLGYIQPQLLLGLIACTVVIFLAPQQYTMLINV